MLEAFFKGLIVALFLGFIVLIRFFINWLRFRNREKLFEENEKKSFLENKFKHLLNTKEGKKEITDIFVTQPYSTKKPWVVYKTMKWGTWPISNNEADEICFSIKDEELNSLEEYIEYKKVKNI
jgi:hypothetical protein